MKRTLCHAASAAAVLLLGCSSDSDQVLDAPGSAAAPGEQATPSPGVGGTGGDTGTEVSGQADALPRIGEIAGDTGTEITGHADSVPEVTAIAVDPDAPKVLAREISLVPLPSCDDVDDAARAAALRAMDDLIDEQLETARERLAEGQCTFYDDIYLDGDWMAAMGGASSTLPTTGAGAAAPAPAEEAPEEVSETNNQVEGIDEADFIKNDADGMIYLVSDGALQIIDGWPPEQSQVIARMPLEDEPRRIFVEGDRILLYSSVPKTAVETAQYQSWWYEDDRECTYGYSCDFTGDGNKTRITIFDITDRTAPTVVRTIDTTATFISARRIGSAVHTVLYEEPELLRTLPIVPEQVTTNGFCTGTTITGTEPNIYETPTPADGDAERLVQLFDELRQQNASVIEQAPIEELMGSTEDQVVGEAVRGRDLEACLGFYDSPLADGTAYLTVMSLDLGTDDPVQASTIVSRPGASYASADAYYVSVRQQPVYEYWYTGLEALEEASTVHKFSLAGSTNRYAASGLVKGRVLNQFSMDEYQEHLRIATTTGYLPSPNVHSTVSVLRQEGTSLGVVGQVDDIAPTEDIRSVRFMGDKGYVVTFKKTDPLFVFDLSDPTAPEAVGELKIPGFSTYLHPLDNGHLLSIGYDSDDQETFAWFTGLLLQIFDVSDPTDPLLLHREVIGARGSSSEAATNHLAFNYFAPRQMLAIPATVCEESAGGGAYAETMTFSGLLLYRVDVTDGFTLHGTVDHPYVDTVDSTRYYVGGECSNWWTESNSVVQRSIFMDDYVYSVSDLRIKVNSLLELTEDVADVPLTADAPASG